MPEPDASTTAPPSVRAALAAAAARLKRAGVEDAAGDARRLLSAALGLSAAQILARPEQELSPEQADRFARHLAERAARKPVSRILGEREFYGRPFRLSPATLDPRPDSETLIDAALGIVRAEGLTERPLRILDVGTGSGCLLLTLLCELPHATGLGTDINPAALEVACQNATRLGVPQRATWREADALDGIGGPFDLLMCNPPYIRSEDIATLEPEVREFDPPLALDGGSDGLHLYRRLAPRIRAVVPDGWALMEFGYDQAGAVAELLASEMPATSNPGFTFHKDVTGTRRCVAWKTREMRI